MRSSLALPPFLFLADECQLHSLSLPLTCSQKPMTKHLWGTFQRLCGTIEGASLRIMESRDLPPQSPYLCDLQQVTEPFWEPVVIICEVERHFRPPKEGQGRSTDDWTPSFLDSWWGMPQDRLCHRTDRRPVPKWEFCRDKFHLFTVFRPSRPTL